MDGNQVYDNLAESILKETESKFVSETLIVRDNNNGNPLFEVTINNNLVADNEEPVFRIANVSTGTTLFAGRYIDFVSVLEYMDEIKEHILNKLRAGKE